MRSFRVAFPFLGGKINRVFSGDFEVDSSGMLRIFEPNPEFKGETLRVHSCYAAGEWKSVEVIHPEASNG